MRNLTTSTRAKHKWFVFFTIAALAGCAAQTGTPIVAQNQTNPKLEKSPKQGPQNTSERKSDYAGLRWWRSYQKSAASKFPVVRTHVLDNAGRPLTASAAIDSLHRILVNSKGNNTGHRTFQIDATKNPPLVLPIKDAARPQPIGDGAVQTVLAEGHWYRIFRDEFFPFALQGAERIEVQTQKSLWLKPNEIPQPLLQRAEFADLADIPWKKVDEERTSYWEGALDQPAHLGPLLIKNGKGEVQQSAALANDRFVAFDNLRVWRYAGNTFVTAQTVPATQQEAQKRSKDPLYLPRLHGTITLASGFYGYNEGAATVYALGGEGKNRKAEIQVLKAANFPPLSFLRPHFFTRGSAGETRDAFVLPGGSGVVYVWRGRAVWPQLPVPNSFEVQVMQPAQASKLPWEIFDCVALVLAKSDGTLRVLDYQVGYTRKLTKIYDPPPRIVLDPSDPTLNTGKEVDEKPDGRIEVAYQAQYVWTPDEKGNLGEQATTGVQGTTFYAEDAMQIAPKAIDNKGNLIYFKGRSLWAVRIELIAHLERYVTLE